MDVDEVDVDELMAENERLKDEVEALRDALGNIYYYSNQLNDMIKDANNL